MQQIRINLLSCSQIVACSRIAKAAALLSNFNLKFEGAKFGAVNFLPFNTILFGKKTLFYLS